MLRRRPGRGHSDWVGVLYVAPCSRPLVHLGLVVLDIFCINHNIKIVILGAGELQVLYHERVPEALSDGRKHRDPRYPRPCINSLYWQYASGQAYYKTLTSNLLQFLNYMFVSSRKAAGKILGQHDPEIARSLLALRPTHSPSLV